MDFFAEPVSLKHNFQRRFECMLYNMYFGHVFGTYGPSACHALFFRLYGLHSAVLRFAHTPAVSWMHVVSSADDVPPHSSPPAAPTKACPIQRRIALACRPMLLHSSRMTAIAPRLVYGQFRQLILCLDPYPGPPCALEAPVPPPHSKP